MYLILNIIISIIYVVLINVMLLKFVAVYQQNYYRTKEAIIWLYNNNNMYYKNTYKLSLFFVPIYMLICLIFFLLKIPYPYYFILHILAFTYIASIDVVINDVPLKKQLVYTKRVKRLLITFSIICVVLFSLLLTLSVKFNYLFMLHSIIYVLTPILIILSNYINYPIQLLINQYYVILARKKLKQYKNLKIIGVTGSFGKTSTKNYLYTILNEKYNVVCSPHSYNTSTGITRTILEYLKPYHDILILEMGADHNNDIEKLCRIVKPDISIITTVGNQHLNTFKTIDNIINTKFQLLKNTKSDGFFVTNYTNEICKFYSNNSLIPTYGIGYGKDDYCLIKNVEINNSGMGIECVIDNNLMRLNTSVLGEFNVINILLSVTVAYKLGLSIDEIIKGVKNIKQVEHRLSTRILPNGTLVIDDSYNSNVEGFKGAVKVLKQMHGRKIIVTCGVVELGEQQYDTNFQLGTLISDIDVCVVNRVNYNAISNGIVSVGGKRPKYYDSYNQCYQQFISKLTSDDVVLIENDLTDLYTN